MRKFLIGLLMFLIGASAGIFFVKSQSRSDARVNEKTAVSSVPEKRRPEAGDSTILSDIAAEERPPVKAYVSIVLDDWGYNTEALDPLLALNEPFTLAILPELPYSVEVAEKARLKGCEIILHMPMEPQTPVNMEELTLLNEMTPDEIRVNLERAIESIPYLTGVSNHTGSAFTENEVQMMHALEVVYQHGLYYFDSMVTAASVGYKIAASRNLPTAKRDVFIDNVREEAVIIGQLNKLAEKAVQNGSAIGIGHDELVTVNAIQKVLPQWKQQGIQLVTLGELMRMRAAKFRAAQEYNRLLEAAQAE